MWVYQIKQIQFIYWFIFNTFHCFYRHSAEILTSDGQIISSNQSQTSERSVRSAPAVPIHDVQLPATYVALYPYKPQKTDELELKKGSIYIVTERWVLYMNFNININCLLPRIFNSACERMQGDCWLPLII